MVARRSCAACLVGTRLQNPTTAVPAIPRKVEGICSQFLPAGMIQWPYSANVLDKSLSRSAISSPSRI